MQYLAILICAMCCLISWQKEKNIYNPLTAMSGLWMVVTILASMRLYGLYAADSIVYLLVTVGIVSFGLGCAVKRRTRFVIGSNQRKLSTELIESTDVGRVKKTVLYALCVLSVLMMIYPDYLAIKSLLSSGFDMSMIRSEFDMSYSNIALRLIYNYIVLPFSFASGPIFASVMFLSNRKDAIVIFSVSFIIFSRLITEGGRVIILYFLLSIIVAFMMTKTKDKEIKRKKIGITFLAAVCVYAVIVVTSLRTNQSLFEHGYSYLCGSVPHLSVRLKEVDSQGVLTYGTASVFGYVNFFFTMLENIGIPYPLFIKKTSSVVNSVVQTTVQISNNKLRFNAFVSPFYYMYCDGRILGVILGMFIYGMVSFYFYNKLKIRRSYQNLSVYLLILQGIVFSFVRIQFAVVHYALAFFFFYLVFDNKNTNTN